MFHLGFLTLIRSNCRPTCCITQRPPRPARRGWARRDSLVAGWMVGDRRDLRALLAALATHPVFTLARRRDVNTESCLIGGVVTLLTCLGLGCLGLLAGLAGVAIRGSR